MEANILSVKPQDLSESVKSSHSELVASGLGSTLRSICSKSCTNLDELAAANGEGSAHAEKRQKYKEAGAMVSQCSGARPQSPEGRDSSVGWSSQGLGGGPPSLFESGISRSTSYFSSLSRRNPRGMEFSS